MARLEGHSARVWDLAASEDGSLLASVSADATLKLWRLNNLDLLTHVNIDSQHEGDIYAVGTFSV